LRGAKLQDITGQRFGKVTVIKQGERVFYPSGGSKINWICECDCGNEVITNGGSLRKGNTTSCGKCRWIDRIGQVFGKLTVVSRVPDIRGADGKLVTTWHCQCECGNTHDVGGNNLVAGNVKSCGCLFDDVQEADLIKRKETFLTNAANIHDNKYEYDLSTFENQSSTIEITCPKHGKFYQAVRDHIFGCGCQKCSIESRSIGLEEFIRRGKEHFGDKYDYSSVQYVNNSTRVKLTCPEHGDFEQLAASHMNGNDCFECSANLRHWNYKAFCKNNEEFANTIGKLYLLRLTNEEESFLKVGVSVGFLNRLAKYRQDGFEVEVLKTSEDIAINIAEKESDLLQFIKTNNFKYIPLTKFAGRTECAVLDAEDLIKERI
jgi:imidazole glycerol phosphate synthase subunit HisF